MLRLIPLCAPRLALTAALALPAGLAAAGPVEGPALEAAGVTVTQEQISSGALTLKQIRKQGMLVFSTPFNTGDGYGDGPVNPGDPISPGGRPSLQANGTLLRVNGLDGQSCLECHSIISNAGVPARFGIGGVGGSVSNAMFQPTYIDVWNADTGFNGRFINPPFLFGSGGVQLLAEEMTRDLQDLAADAIQNPGQDIPLESKGVGFGSIRYENGQLDVSNVVGVDDDLVVRPFGRKGEFATVRGFDIGAMAFHFGMQPVEAVGEGVDDDGDGVVDEITIGELSALEIFNTNLEIPFEQNLSSAAKQGEERFSALGCAGCHVPELKTESRVLEYRVDENDEPHYSVNLSSAPTSFKGVKKAGVAVRLFADLKRHDMGDGLKESFGSDLDSFFTTARLWGVADTAPYLHDGRAPTLSEAILLHGGEGGDAALAFSNLSPAEQMELIEYLRSLRTPRNPAGDLE